METQRGHYNPRAWDRPWILQRQRVDDLVTNCPERFYLLRPPQLAASLLVFLCRIPDMRNAKIGRAYRERSQNTSHRYCSAQTEEACNEKYNDNDADDVENIHDLLRLRLCEFNMKGLQSKTYWHACKFHIPFHIAGDTKQRRCPLLAHSGHSCLHCTCL